MNLRHLCRTRRHVQDRSRTRHRSEAASNSTWAASEHSRDASATKHGCRLAICVRLGSKRHFIHTRQQTRVARTTSAAAALEAAELAPSRRRISDEGTSATSRCPPGRALARRQRPCSACEIALRAVRVEGPSKIVAEQSTVCKKNEQLSIYPAVCRKHLHVYTRTCLLECSSLDVCKICARPVASVSLHERSSPCDDTRRHEHAGSLTRVAASTLTAAARTP